MIGHISETGKYIAVTGGPASNYVNNSNYMSVGSLQYNTNNQRLEMYNGTSWQPLNMGQYYVGLNPEAEKILDWARVKMYEEQCLHERLAQHPGLREAYEQFRVMDILTLEDKK
jgi:hypothetical protein